MKAIIIGIDGGTWDILSHAMERGMLPNMKRLINDGTYGSLHSVVPPITGPAWASFMTGTKPHTHGICDFVIDEGTNSRVVTRNDMRYPPFYEILSEHGLRCIIIALPLSYPPKNINGIMLPDFFSPKLYAYPKNAEVYLKRYRVSPDITKKGSALVDELVKFESEHMEVAKEIFENEYWDIFFIHFISSDIISHHHFGDIVRNNATGKYALKVFKEIDKNIGWFMKNRPEDCIIIVLSDHGFKEYQKVFYINTYLMKRRYLSIKQISGKTERPREIFELTDRKKEIIIPYILYKIVNVKPIRKITKWIFIRFFGKKYRIRGGYGIDVEKSIFYLPRTTSFGIYANYNNLTDNRLIQKLHNELQYLMDHQTNNKIFSHVSMVQSQDSKIPCIIFFSEDYFISPLIRNKIIDDERINYHSMNGIVIFYGEHIKKGYVLENAYIYDIIPTLLHILKMPLPSYMDGTILRDIFCEDSEYLTRESKYINHLKLLYEKRLIKRKIKNLKKSGRI